MDAFTIIVIAAGVALILGWIPGLIAYERHHPNRQAILIAGFLGIILFFPVWIVALVWSFTGEAQPVHHRRRVIRPNRGSAVDALEHLRP